MAKMVGMIIKERREQIHMTKSALSRALGCSPQNIESLENRKSVDFELAERLCEILDFDLFAYYRGHSFGKQVDNEELQLKLQEIKDKYTQLLEKHTLLLERIAMQNSQGKEIQVIS